LGCLVTLPNLVPPPLKANPAFFGNHPQSFSARDARRWCVGEAQKQPKPVYCTLSASRLNNETPALSQRWKEAEDKLKIFVLNL